MPRKLIKINWLFNFSFMFFMLVLAGCTAHYPVNESITSIDKSEGYRLELVRKSPERSESLVVVVAFSGGGTRAAAFAYGVMEAMRDIKITWEGRERRLLDEVDSITSVSGGSFPAAYYGLFGDRIFEDFEEKFLDVDVQGHLKGSFLNPFNWFMIGSTMFGRSDFAANYYDEILFEGKTYNDMLKREDAPLIQINATEVSTGTQFTFIQNIFDLLCADLSTFPVSRAVAASSAVPILFSSITINNHAGTCGFELRPQAKAALNDPNRFSRRRHLLEKYVKYLDSETYPYLHLYDGGLTDNLGIRPGLNRFAVAGDAWEFVKERKMEGVKRLVFIVVNAQAEAKTQFSKQARSVPLFDAILGATSIPLNEYTFESLVTLKVTLDKFKDQMIAGRCADKEYLNTNDCDDFKDYLIYVDLDQLQDKEQRDRLKQLPTSFVLQPEEVDELRKAAKTVLLNSKKLQQLLDDLK
jgi:NTE family protein